MWGLPLADTPSAMGGLGRQLRQEAAKEKHRVRVRVSGVFPAMGEDQELGVAGDVAQLSGHTPWLSWSCLDELKLYELNSM